jgi:hypothetical protein
MLAPNTYFAKPIGCSVEESGDNKTPTFVVDLAITHEAKGGEWAPIGEEKRTLYLYLSDAAWPYAAKDLERLGFNGDFERPAISKIEGFEVKCVQEMYQGKTKEKWSLAREGEREKKPASKDALRLLAAKWKNAAPAPRPSSAPPKPALPPAPAGAPEYDTSFP